MEASRGDGQNLGVVSLIITALDHGTGLLMHVRATPSRQLLLDLISRIHG